MADLKLQGRTHLQVVPSDTINQPFPGDLVASGSATSAPSGANDLIDSAAVFTETVKVGDVVLNYTDGTIDTVSAVVDDNNLTLASGTVPDTKAYRIYSPNKINRDFVVYVGVTGDVALVDGNGNVEVYKDVPTGMVIPVMGGRVNDTGTGATNMVAIW
jgi:hypothetical protein